MLYTIPIHVTVDAASPEAASKLAQKALTLLNDSITKMLLQTQGLPVKSAKVGAPFTGERAI